MLRSRSWFGGSLWRNKNPHSLEHLKYLHNVLSKNQTVSENNRGLLVETLRSIAEILIWGDQNDSSVFDFFLEKNMLSFFLKILKQKCGSYVCVQLLQTLNILFENIRNETSLYYLLSNNHVNSIIVHKFDFSDEEVMAYYISFLKTLSLKLNSHTIHFFYNDHTNDFPLYTEAIKFFKHPESMVRIAVRTLTLNVYRVQDSSMLHFIRNKTAVPYFSNLVWFIGNHVLELDTCVRNDADHQSQTRLSDLVAEHLDHLHYLTDILNLNIEALNDVLVDHLLNKLFIPLYIFSLLPAHSNTIKEGNPRVSSVVSLFLLSQVFLISRQRPLVQDLAHTILRGTSVNGENGSVLAQAAPVFVAPTKTLEESLDSDTVPTSGADGTTDDLNGSLTNLNITDEEKEQMLAQETPKIFLDVIVNCLNCTENDYSALFGLCLLHAISHNTGISPDLLDGLLIPSSNPEQRPGYTSWLVQKLINIITLSCQLGCKVRLVTLDLAISLLLRLTLNDGSSLLTDAHLAAVIAAREESTSLLRNYYKREDIFGDMFESEDEELRKKPLNVEWLMMDSNILLPPTGTPLTGIEFNKRLPCGEVERARRAIRVFLLVRDLCLKLSAEKETQLPLTNRNDCIQNNTVLDLTNSDLLSCHVIGPDGVRNHRFLVVESNQIILVVPVPGHLGFGQPKLSALLHDLDVTADKQDVKSLYISAKYTTAGPMVNTRFIFDDSIRCLAAQQRLSKGRMKARDEKMRQLERLLDIPLTDSPPYLHHLRHNHTSDVRSRLKMESTLQNRYASTSNMQETTETGSQYGRPLFAHRIPGCATPIRIPPTSPRISRATDRDKTGVAVGGESRNSSTSSKSPREGSPKMPRPRSEEIQLENIHSKREVTPNANTGSALEGAAGTIVSNPTSSSVDKSAAGPEKGGTSSGGPPNKETSFSQPQPPPAPLLQSSHHENKTRRKGKVETV